MRAIKQLLLLWRDSFTGWWLLEVCDCPRAAVAFAEEVAKELGLGTEGLPSSKGND